MSYLLRHASGTSHYLVYPRLLSGLVCPDSFIGALSAHNQRSISEVIARDPKCPMVCCLLTVPSTASLMNSQDRRPLTIRDLVAPPPPTDLTQVPVTQADEIELCTGSSAKIDQLLHLLNLIPHDSKSLVFSQFTSFLDKVIIFYDPPHVCIDTPTDW